MTTSYQAFFIPQNIEWANPFDHVLTKTIQLFFPLFKEIRKDNYLPLSCTESNTLLTMIVSAGTILSAYIISH